MCNCKEGIMRENSEIEVKKDFLLEGEWGLILVPKSLKGCPGKFCQDWKHYWLILKAHCQTLLKNPVVISRIHNLTWRGTHIREKSSENQVLIIQLMSGLNMVYCLNIWSNTSKTIHFVLLDIHFEKSFIMVDHCLVVSRKDEQS